MATNESPCGVGTEMHGGQRPDIATDRCDPVGVADASSIVDRGSAGSGAGSNGAAGLRTRRGTSGSWPDWALEDLAGAISYAERVGPAAVTATELRREWYRPRLGGFILRPVRPLAGLYRGAHAGSGTRRRRGELHVVDRHDVIGPDGWWRTWGEHWTPPRTRPGSVRLLLSPNPQYLAEFVRVVTDRLRPVAGPWSFACSTDPRRIRQTGAATLDLGAYGDLPDGLIASLAPLMHPARAPLSLPVAPGIGAVVYPRNGMTFGEHRCHLVALALRRAAGERDPLQEIAAVFRVHGINPAAPYRTRAEEL